MENKKVLIAITSETIRQILAEFLLQAEFQVLESKNIIETFEKVYNELPDAVIISTDFPVMTGYDFSHIIKTHNDLKNIVVILCSNDEINESRFWAENSQCDGFYVPTSNNLHILYSLLKNKIVGIPMQKKIKPKKIDEAGLLHLTVDTLGRELFDLYVIRMVFNASNYIWDIDQLLSHMAKTISSIYTYDALGIIVNDNTLVEFYDHTSSISNEDFKDFRKICQADFMERIPNRKEYNWEASITTETLIDQFSEKKSKIKTYDVYPLDVSKKFPVTIHIANCGIGTVNSRTRSRLDFVTEIYSPLIEKTIAYKKIKMAETKIRTAFSHFLPLKVIDRIVEGDNLITTNIGEQRKVAILMADIRNFTTITEENRPEDIISFLNSYFSKMGKIIQKHGGTIDKFMGDEIMALFGVPESYKYNGARAANAALEMIEEIKKMDTGILRLPEGIKFTVGIGIHYGTPIAGTIGSENKKEYTVIGDDVNLASRIQDLTKQYGTQIIISGAVRKDIEDASKDLVYENYLATKIPFRTRYLDIVKVKGKSIPVEIYELTSDVQKYSWEFLENYNKALYLYRIGNFNGAQDYLRVAKNQMSDDMATKVILARCKEFVKNKPVNWDGAITLTAK